MKSHYIVLIITLTFLKMLTAQENSINIELNRNAGSEKEWNIKLSTTISSEFQNGFYVEVPEGVKIMPVSVKINGEQKWLLNSDTITDSDSIIFWNDDQSGIMIRYASGVLNREDSCEMEYLASIGNPDLEGELIRILDLDQNPDGFVKSDRIIATGVFPSLSNR